MNYRRKDLVAKGGMYLALALSGEAEAQMLMMMVELLRYLDLEYLM
jgi:hypothetical protein